MQLPTHTSVMDLGSAFDNNLIIECQNDSENFDFECKVQSSSLTNTSKAHQGNSPNFGWHPHNLPVLFFRSKMFC